MPADPRAEYERRRARWAAAIARGDRRHLFVSNLRLAAVVLASLLAWLGFARAIVSPAWTLVPVAAFLALMVVHALVLNARDRAVNARDYYDRGFKRLDGSWIGSGPDGARFLDGAWNSIPEAPVSAPFVVHYPGIPLEDRLAQLRALALVGA